MSKKIVNTPYFQTILVFIVIFIFYLLCLPTGIALEDDGLFLLSLYFNGISHPPGYPLHSLIGYFVTHIPFATPAFNGHALSAFFSALSAILVFQITLLLGFNNLSKRLTAYVATFAFVLSSGIWSQSIITEVYTLNIFLFLSVFYLTLIFNSLQQTALSPLNTKKTKWTLFFLSLTTGLALANHWPLFILGSLGILFILSKHIKILIKNSHILTLGLILGLTPYIWLYFNSNSNTIIKFLGSIQSWQEFYDYVSRKNYNQSIDFSSTATYIDKINYFIYTNKQLLNQWGMLNIIFIPIGLIKIFRSDIKNKSIFYGLVISYLSASYLLIMILDYDFNIGFQVNLIPFLVLSHSLGAIIFAFGLVTSIKYISDNTNINLAPALLLLSLLQAITHGLPVNNRSNYTWGDNYAKQVLNSLKPNSILFVSGDVATGTIGYWHLVMKYRPDISLIQEGGEIIYNTRLFDSRHTPPKARKKLVLDYLQSTEQPVYFLNNVINIGVINHWLLYEYKSSIKDKYIYTQELSLANKLYLDYVFSDIKHTDNWTKMHIKKLRGRALRHLILMVDTANDDAKKNKYKHYISKIANDLSGLTTTLLTLHDLNKIHYIGTKKNLLKQGWELFEQEDSKEFKAKFINLVAKIEFENNTQQSERLYKRSLKIWNTSANEAYYKLKDKDKDKH